MALPVPELDDRRFQDLVDDAKRRVQRECPKWTDHNVSDPGVTLIELMAWMTDQLVYRVNRVPDRLYVKFLELIGVNLFPPTAARAPVTFWLAAPQPDVVRIPTGTSVATVRTETEAAIAFSTVEDLNIVPSSLARIGSMIDGSNIRDHGQALAKGSGFACFDNVPKTDDALYIDMPDPTPSCAITLRFRCETAAGGGVLPGNPPLVWEAWDGDEWRACELDSDQTGGLNHDGDVIIHVPRTHVATVVGRAKLGRLRARVTEPRENQPRYDGSPVINAVDVFTIGGTAEAVNAELVESEDLGVSEGVSGQRFALTRRPVVPGDDPPTLVVGDEEEWRLVGSFAESGPDDHHFTLDVVAGEVQLGPGVRQADGSFRRYGAVPPQGVRLTLRTYRTGGGSAGNVAQGAITVLKSSIPYVTKVENRREALGGVDGEDIENAKIRGPILLRTRGRAVTAEDYEHLAREAAPEVARVRALAAGGPTEAGSVELLVVPWAATDNARLVLDQLVPDPATLRAISDRLETTRVVGTRLIVKRPQYVGVQINARIKPRARTKEGRLRESALDALYAYFDPIRGGPEGTGWPFGRPVNVGEVYSVLQAVPGAELVESVELIGVDLDSGKLSPPADRVELHDNELILSVGHTVNGEAE